MYLEVSFNILLVLFIAYGCFAIKVKKKFPVMLELMLFLQLEAFILINRYPNGYLVAPVILYILMTESSRSLDRILISTYAELCSLQKAVHKSNALSKSRHNEFIKSIKEDLDKTIKFLDLKEEE